MIKGNPRFGYELTCDICGEGTATVLRIPSQASRLASSASLEEFDYFDYVLEYRKDLGWLRKKYKGEWQDICPECQEG